MDTGEAQVHMLALSALLLMGKSAVVSMSFGKAISRVMATTLTTVIPLHCQLLSIPCAYSFWHFLIAQGGRTNDLPTRRSLNSRYWDTLRSWGSRLSTQIRRCSHSPALGLTAKAMQSFQTTTSWVCCRQNSFAYLVKLVSSNLSQISDLLDQQVLVSTFSTIAMFAI